MRRADRLFAIIQFLRGKRRPVTGGELARELEVTLRTIYRDMAELSAQRVPIRGEAGTGYVIEAGYDLPPLTLTADELEAAMLGAAWVAQRGDRGLSRGARSLIHKLSEVCPPELRPILLDAGLRAAPPRSPNPDGLDIADVRAAIRERHKVALAYTDDAGKLTRRTIWPFMLAYMEDVRVLVGHCELRGDFRHFRTDRVREARVLPEKYSPSPRELRKRWDEANPQRSRVAKQP